MRRRVPIAFAMFLAASGARAASFPTRGGESGYLDVPSAEVALPGGGMIGAEFGLQQYPGRPVDAAPLPLSLVTGLGRGLEAGMSVRDGGRPGDPRPSPTLFGAALKLKMLEASGYSPAVALDVNVDRFNWDGVTGVRAIASTARIGRVNLASYVGLEGHGPGLSVGPTAGLASALLLTPRTDTVFEVTAGPRGPLLGGAVRYALDQRTGLSFGVDWLPRESGVRFNIGVALSAEGPRVRPARRPAAAAPAAVAQGPKEPVFLDDRPHFRLSMPAVAPSTERDPRHLQYGPWVDRGPRVAVAVGQGARPAGPLVKGAGVSSLESEVRALDRRQANIEELERRIVAAKLQAEARQKKLAEETKRLAATESQLQARASQELSQEKALGPLTHPDEQQRHLLVTLQTMRTREADLGSAEQAASLALSAAEQRVAQAAIREQGTSEDLPRLEQRVTSTEPGQRRNLARREWLDARERRVVAAQERLAAMQDQLDAVERGAHARADRLASLDKRIGLAVDLLALRTGAKQPGASAVASSAPSPATAAKTQGTVAVAAALPPVPAPSVPTPNVPAPAPIVPAAPAVAKALPALAPAQAPSGEKQVIAAGLIALESPGQALDDLDRQTIAGIARQATGPSTFVTVVARARTADLLPAAAKRGEEIKAALAAAGPVSPSRIEVRTVLHPRETSVGLVISAYRYLTPSSNSARPEPGRSAP